MDRFFLCIEMGVSADGGARRCGRIGCVRREIDQVYVRSHSVCLRPSLSASSLSLCLCLFPPRWQFPCLYDHERPHHVVLLMFEDVAMPHVQTYSHKNTARTNKMRRQERTTTTRRDPGGCVEGVGMQQLDAGLR